MLDDSSLLAFTAGLGLPGLVDIHVHFMPDNVLRMVWAYFDRVGDVRYPTQFLRRGLGGQAARQPGRHELDQQHVQSVDQLGPSANQVITVFGHRPQCSDCPVDLDSAQRRRGQRGYPYRSGVGRIVLAAVARREQPHATGQLRRNIDHDDAVLTQPFGQRCTKSRGAFDRPTRLSPATAMGPA